jgi:hypothetical protein
MSCSVTADVTLIFLDANILSKAVTRTLLIVGGVPSGFRAVWSMAAEHEAAGHMRPRAVPPGVIRERYGIELSPSGSDAARFAATKESDRQILADAVEAGARFLVTEDVDDFNTDDLAGVGISAVNHDVFLAERLSREAYLAVIDLFVQRQVAPPTTPAQFHAAVARKHPRLFAAHSDVYDIAPESSGENEPEHIFRGPRCLRCERLTITAATLTDELCAECRATGATLT